MNNTLALLDNNVLKLAIEQSREGMAIYDNQGACIYMNPAMAAMYGYEVDEVIGQSWHLFYDPQNIQKIEEGCLPALTDKGYSRSELQGRKKNSTTFDVEVTLTLLQDEEENPVGMVCRSQDLTHSKRTQLELTIQKQQYQLVFDHSPILIANIGLDYCYNMANKQYCEWAGKLPEEIIGSHVKNILGDIGFELAKPRIDQVLSGQHVSFEAKVLHSSGVDKWVNVSYVPERGPDGRVKGFYGFIVDIDERRRKEFINHSLMMAIEKGTEGFSLYEQDGNFIYVNSAQADMYGYQPDELLGGSWKQLYDAAQIEEIESLYLSQLLRDGQSRGELKGLRKNGELFDVEASFTQLKDEFGNHVGMFCSCRDISEHKRSRAEVDFLAYHDHLTGLPNRLQFKKSLEQALIRAQQQGDMLAVLFIDLDHFKYVNDTLGHSVGDQLLRKVADKIQSVFRTEDTVVARLSGDEFTVLLCDLAHQRSVDNIVDKLMQVFRAPIYVGDYKFFQGISVGISMYPQDGQDVEALMKNADAAMYRAKEEGRQDYRYYMPSLTDSAYESMLFRSQLQNALDKNEFELHYQPVISLEENRIIGFEALIRWRHPELGLIYPDKFIRYAEESNFIVLIGYWVIEQACQQIKAWRQMGLSIERIALNVSGVQLQQTTFANKVAEILSDTNTPANLFEFEITETFLMKGLKQPVAQLEALRALSISLAIDDFGVGYSSLSQLKQLSTQCLKIDRSFVNDIVTDPDACAIVEAIIAMGKTLKLDITAEGVEEFAQHTLLCKLGCKNTQGYFYAKPCPPQDIPSLYEALNERLKAL